MPRVNPLRTLVNEGNLARRIAYERERAGQSYAGLAKRMEEAGYPMQASALFKIEKGEPPRRITVDELVGFSMVFGVPVDELLMPPELVADKAMMAALGELADARADFEHAKSALEQTEERVARELAKLGVKIGDTEAGVASDGMAWSVTPVKGKPTPEKGTRRGKR
jgi:transcriptional regulator with XRE-family HTH domain